MGVCVCACAGAGRAQGGRRGSRVLSGTSVGLAVGRLATPLQLTWLPLGVLQLNSSVRMLIQTMVAFM